MLHVVPPYSASVPSGKRAGVPGVTGCSRSVAIAVDSAAATGENHATASEAGFRQPGIVGKGANHEIDNGGTATRTIPTTRAYAAPDSQSARLWQRAQDVLPGGNTRTTVFMAPRPL